MVTALLTAFLLGVGASVASAGVFLPPAHKLFQGVTDQPVAAYARATGKHPAIYQDFIPWGQWLPGIEQNALSIHARMMLAIGTVYGSHEAITPGRIAQGRGDAWLIALAQAIYASHNVTYVRLMGEMNGYWNAYCAYNADGSRRNAAHSTSAYRQAWKRVTLIMRGGSLQHIDSVLQRLGMPPLHATHDLPQPEVAMLWVPEADPGSPAVAGNRVSAYWPGGNWVDWIGTDFYSGFPNFAGITALYNEFPGKPFVFAEYALWKSGDDVGFIDRLFSWMRHEGRVRMLMYNQGWGGEPFQLALYPRAARELGRLLASPMFPAYAPEWVGVSSPSPSPA